MADRIKIDHVTGGSDGANLKDCYFVPAGTTPPTYDFYDKDNDNPNNPLETGVRRGTTFTFRLAEDPGLPWRMVVRTISDSEASGEWATGSRVDTGLEEGSGHFQAQAGGGTDPDEAASSARA